MRTFIEKHLETVTVKTLTNFKHHNSFCCFASSAGEKGLVQIGVDGNGMFVVKESDKNGSISTFYSRASKAIEYYTELVI